MLVINTCARAAARRSMAQHGAGRRRRQRNVPSDAETLGRSTISDGEVLEVICRSETNRIQQLPQSSYNIYDYQYVDRGLVADGQL